MKASELIAELQKAIAEHGDCRVRVYDCRAVMPFAHHVYEECGDIVVEAETEASDE